MSRTRQPGPGPQPAPQRAGPLICPVCAEPLRHHADGYDCSRGHRYDVNRHGYVDLLPHGHGRSGRTGDTREMIAARVRFLDAGHYQPLHETLARYAKRGAATSRPGGDDTTVLDAGCGDGYYLTGVLTALRGGDGDDSGDREGSGGSSDGGGGNRRTVRGFGCDISSAALRAAGRRGRDSTLFLNDVTYGICMADGSVDVLLNVFAPRDAGEFARLVRPGGILLVAIPGPAHLQELADLLPIGMAADKRTGVASLFHEDFRETGSTVLEYAMALEEDDVANLLAMTPGAFHGSVPADRLPRELEVTASFDVLAFTRR